MQLTGSLRQPACSLPKEQWKLPTCALAARAYADVAHLQVGDAAAIVEEQPGGCEGDRHSRRRHSGQRGRQIAGQQVARLVWQVLCSLACVCSVAPRPGRLRDCGADAARQLSPRTASPGAHSAPACVCMHAGLDCVLGQRCEPSSIQLLVSGLHVQPDCILHQQCAAFVVCSC